MLTAHQLLRGRSLPTPETSGPVFCHRKTRARPLTSWEKAANSRSFKNRSV
jgi:hypothetical protein